MPTPSPPATPMIAVLDDAIRREKEATFAAAGAARVPATRIAIVTGGTRGVGREIVRGLCAAGGYRVLILARNEAEGADVCGEEPDTTFLVCDLASLASVYHCGEQIQRSCPRVHLLVNCAGMVPTSERMETVDGNEVALATNVLGPHLLTTMLLEQMGAAPHLAVEI
jgi:dehydrogenase/reductase SDR family protein 12